MNCIKINSNGVSDTIRILNSKVTTWAYSVVNSARRHDLRCLSYRKNRDCLSYSNMHMHTYHTWGCLDELQIQTVNVWIVITCMHFNQGHNGLIESWWVSQKSYCIGVDSSKSVNLKWNYKPVWPSRCRPIKASTRSLVSRTSPRLSAMSAVFALASFA